MKTLIIEAVKVWNWIDSGFGVCAEIDQTDDKGLQYYAGTLYWLVPSADGAPVVQELDRVRMGEQTMRQALERLTVMGYDPDEEIMTAGSKDLYKMIYGGKRDLQVHTP